jgi:hypothetical protein
LEEGKECTWNIKNFRMQQKQQLAAFWLQEKSLQDMS